MPWDPLLTEGWPSEWSPLTVVVRPSGDLIELVAEGHVDAWTVGALVRTLVAVYEPSFSDVHIDLRDATGCDPATEAGLARCRDFANSRGAGFRVTPPGIPRGASVASEALTATP